MQSQFRTTGYLTEIQAVPGRELVDGTTFSLSSQLVTASQGFTTFEFVRGASFNLPGGNAILDGQQISIDGPAGTTVLTLTTDPSGADPTEVGFARSDSASEIASAVAAALQLLDADLEAFAVGPQVRLPEAESFALSPERFAATSVTVPDDVNTLVGQSLSFTNSIGVETSFTFRTSQELSFGGGGQTVTVTSDFTGAADGVQIRFIDRESFGDNPAQATYSPFDRVITVAYNSLAATPENADFDAVVAALDSLGQFSATLATGDGTQPFVRPAGVVAFSEDEFFFDPAVVTAEQIADDLANRINNRDPRLPALADGTELVVLNAAAVDLDPAFGSPNSFNAGMPGTQLLANGNVPVFYNPTMTDVEVRDAIRDALAVGIGVRNPITGMTEASQDHFPGYATNRIRVFEQAFAGNNSAVGFGTFLPGDEFGSFGSLQVSNSGTSGRLNRHGALNNSVEGVYIDDITIGFASRGEVVLNAPTGNRDFTIDPTYRELRTQDSHQPERPNEILVGGYTLETRGGPEYGVPEDYDPIRLGLNEQFAWGRSFDVNERFNPGAVTLNVPTGRELTDGETLVISNGTRSVTFEFDSDGSVAPGHVRVPFIPVMTGASFDHLTDEPAEVARALRDAINSPQARNVLGITAAGGDSQEVSGMTGNRVELFGEEIRVNPSSGRFLKIDMVAEETPYGRETARTLPISDQEDASVVRDVSPNELARATVTEYVDGQADTLLAKGKIGDTVITGDANELIPTDPINDRDIVKVFLNAGDTIDVKLHSVDWNRGAPFRTPRAQIFSDGETPTQLADSLDYDPFDSFDPNNPFGFVNPVPRDEIRIDSAINGFVAPSDGYYYVAVSSAAAGVTGGDPTFLIGQYQLTIRPSGQVGSEPVTAEYHLESGDTNVERAQGQLIIDSNFISDFSQTGVRATYSGDQIPGRTTQSPLQFGPAGTALLRNQNTERLLPGTVISNNVITATAGTGIEFSGINPAGGQAPPPVPFGRIVNNTVVGPGSGTGINVTNSTSPTVLNNVVSGFNVGLNVAGNSASTVSNGNAFHDNNTPSNRPLGSQSFVIPASEEIFQDAARRIFIPAAEARIIDSSFANLNDRSAFFNTVKAPVGISASPIIAPVFDAYGIPRVDDPAVTTPGGVGGNVFIDRGGIDRADFVQPSAVLVAPVDFIAGQGAQAAGGDSDPDASFVQLPPTSPAVPFFEIQLLDPSGTGPDVSTITEETVILTENGVTLTPGVDYTFGYSDNSRLIRLTPLAGLWRPDAVYEVTLNNKDRVILTLPRGDQIEDGDQYIFTDSDDRQSVFEFDSGYVMQIPQTLGIQVLGPNTFFQDGDAFRITSPGGTSQTFEINLSGAVASGNIEIDLADAGTVQEIRDVILGVLEDHAADLDLRPRALGSNAVQIGSLAGHSIENSVDGLDYFGTDAGVEAGQQFRYQTDSQNVLFEFDVDGSGVSNGAVPVAIERTDAVDEIAEAIAAAVEAEQLGLTNPRAIGDGRVLLGGTADDVLTVNASVLTLVGQPGVTGPLTLTVPNNATAAGLNGRTFAVDNGDVRVDFVFTTDPNLQTPNRRVVLAGGASPTQIAARIAEEIRAGFTGELPATSAGRVVTLAEQPAVIPEGNEQILAAIDTGSSPLIVGGVSGGAIPVPFIPSGQFAPSAAAAALTAAIASSPLDVTTVTPGGGTLLFGDTELIELRTAGGVVSMIGQPLPAVSDLAGNAVESNRDNDETRFTIIMPEIEFDFGDAPDSYGTLRASNGARHTISSERTPRLGTYVDTEADGSPFPDSDDARLPIVSAESGGVFTFDTSVDGVLRIAADGGDPVGGETVTLEIGSQSTTFELVDASSNPSPGNVPVVLNDDDTPEILLQRLADEIRPRLDGTGGGVLISLEPDDPTAIVLEAIDDEDGISIGTFTVDGTPYRVFTEPGTDPDNVPPEAILGFLNPLDPSGTTVPITATGSGLVNAWIDFNQDGVFDEDEQILQNEVVVDGVNRIQVFAPENALDGDTWARFRISDSGNLSPTGVAVGGEVEDYLVSVLRVPAPTAVDDAYTTEEDTPLVVDAAPDRLVDNDLDLGDQILPPRVFVIDTPSNGTLTITDPFEGTFEYIPDPNFNGVDTFTYVLSSQTSVGDGSDVGSVATVTIDVAAVNDPPEFDIVDQFDVLERDDESPTVIADFITNALPGPATATDEIATQDVIFGIDDDQSDIPPGLFVQDPVVDDEGQLVFTQAADQFGTATLVITVTDDDPTDPQIVETTVTLNVRPVNDAPRSESDLFGESDFDDPDDGYVVADGDDGTVPPDQQPDLGRTEGTILYTTKEDDAPFFIPLQRPDGVIGFNRIGLLDVFNVGPENESEDLPGGSQTLSVSSVPMTTARGGTLAEVFDNGVLIGYHYSPPTDFNRDIGIDFFTYEVIDDNPDDGETWSLEEGELVEDRRTATGTVELLINPVNDRPQFVLSTDQLTAAEDSASLVVENFATNIFAGPQLTALDEIDPVTGQSVEFTVSSLTFPESQSLQFFDVYPTITPEGTLTYKPAADVFGSFEFEVVLTDDGPDNSIRGDQVSSMPQLLTIDINPINDPPRLLDGEPPLEFTLLEDNSVVIPVRGDSAMRGLLDIFTVGPANEAADILPEPGGNQSIRLASPVPASTAGGGTLSPNVVAGEIVSLTYTPRANFNGLDSFIFSVIDDGVTVDLGGNVINDPRRSFATVTLDVTPVNDPPQFSGAGDVTSLEDAGLVEVSDWATNVQAGPPGAIDEIDGTDLRPAQERTFVVEPVAQPGSDEYDRVVALFEELPTAVVDGNAATLRYRAAENQNGEASFRVRLLDDGGTANGGVDASGFRTFTIGVEAVNDPPQFVPGGVVTVDEDSGPYNEPWASEVGPGPENAFDEADQDVAFEVATPSEYEDLFAVLPQIDENGVLTFTPAENAAGEAFIDVTAIDSDGGTSETVTLEIVIVDINDPPVAVDDEFETDEDTVIVLPSTSILGNDIDPDLATNPSEFLTIVLDEAFTSQRGAAVSYDPVTGEVTYDPTTSASLQALGPNESAIDTFVYRVVDSEGVLSNPATIEIEVDGVNDAPVTVDDVATLNQSGSTTLRVLDNDFDVDGSIDPNSLRISLLPAFGAVSVGSAGTLVYTPFSQFSGQDEFSYTVADSLGLRSEEAVVRVSFNAPPVAANDGAMTVRDQSVEIDVAANDNDPDGTLNLNSIQIANAPTRGQAVPLGNGRVRYIPDPGFVGNDSFRYSIRDNEGQISNVANVTVRVVASAGQNPVIATDVNADSFTTAIDALLIVNKLSRDLGPGQSTIPIDPSDPTPPYYDVNGDARISSLDALLVINALSRQSGSGEGEGNAGSESTDNSDSAPIAPPESSTSVETAASFWDQDSVPPLDPSPRTKSKSDVWEAEALELDADADDLIDSVANGREKSGDGDDTLTAIDQALALLD